MLFHSFEFACLFIAALVLFYGLPSKSRIYILALADIVFYVVSGLEYLLLFMAISGLVFFCAQKVKGPNPKFFFGVGILLTVANLVFFKYMGFLVANLNFLFPTHLFAHSNFIAHIVLPVGISFYTFQLLAYLIDVHKQKIEPSQNILEFWVFISFFGSLIAGPIMRGKDFLPQVSSLEKSRFRFENLKWGFYYITLGLVKKIVLADFLAGHADFYFSQTANLQTLDAWFAAYLFAFQIYFDFSAYSDMAVGIGKCFGFRLDANFRTPYLSANPTEFWKRWHITLSNWIRDYIYIPLGGSKRGLWLQCLFILIAMLISGLWHGASWTFVVWGFYHGLLLVGHKLFQVIRQKIPLFHSFKDSLLGRLTAVFLFFQITTLGWVFFRAQNLTEAKSLWVKMLGFTQVEYHPIYLLYFGFIAFLCFLHMAEYQLMRHKRICALFWEEKVPAFLRGAFYALLLVVFVLLIKTEQSTFIYFQF